MAPTDRDPDRLDPLMVPMGAFEAELYRAARDARPDGTYVDALLAAHRARFGEPEQLAYAAHPDTMDAHSPAAEPLTLAELEAVHGSGAPAVGAYVAEHRRWNRPGSVEPIYQYGKLLKSGEYGRMGGMPAAKPPTSIFGRRLRSARTLCGLTLAQLGAVALGIEDAKKAAPRISRYEGGERVPDPETVQALADALGVPAAYFHATNDLMADIILRVSKLPQKSQKQLLEHIKTLPAKR